MSEFPRCKCDHALLIHEDVKDPKTGKVKKYAGPCMFKTPAGTKSDGKTNNNGGYCGCEAGVPWPLHHSGVIPPLKP